MSVDRVLIIRGARWRAPVLCTAFSDPGNAAAFPRIAYPGRDVMGRCGGRRARSRTAIVGIILMIVGALLFLIFVPRWVWTGALGVVFISVGFLLWRFSE